MMSADDLVLLFAFYSFSCVLLNLLSLSLYSLSVFSLPLFLFLFLSAFFSRENKGNEPEFISFG
jgi:hypothetical protein